MPSGRRINQHVQSLLQPRVSLGQQLATGTGATNPHRKVLLEMGSAVLQFTESRYDGITSHTRDEGNIRHTAPTQGGGFGRNPQSAHVLVHHRG